MMVNAGNNPKIGFFDKNGNSVGEFDTPLIFRILSFGSEISVLKVTEDGFIEWGISQYKEKNSTVLSR